MAVAEAVKAAVSAAVEAVAVAAAQPFAAEHGGGCWGRAAAVVARQRLGGVRWQAGGRGLGGRALRWCALFGPKIPPSRALQLLPAGERQLQILCFNRQPFSSLLATAAIAATADAATPPLLLLLLFQCQ